MNLTLFRTLSESPVFSCIDLRCPADTLSRETHLSFDCCAYSAELVGKTAKYCLINSLCAFEGSLAVEPSTRKSISAIKSSIVRRMVEHSVTYPLSANI